MEFRKKIDITKSDFRIRHQTKMMLFGSCFAKNIGKQLTDYKFRVDVNPFGILYNPASIKQAIELLLNNKKFGKEDLLYKESSYHTFYHHSIFSDTNKDVFLKRINERRKEASKHFSEAEVLLITWGTAYAYHLKGDNELIVSNCHKLPASSFIKQRLSVETIVKEWEVLIANIRQVNPIIKILFTVSPIRHWKDGAHNNQLSKSTLLLAIDELRQKFSGVAYFPSYEIMLDELRDYRFYKEDMLHPSELAITYIWERFCDTYFDETTTHINRLWEDIRKAISHKPFNQESKLHKQFLRQTLLKINDLKNKYPYFECQKEINTLTEKLSNL